MWIKKSNKKLLIIIAIVGCLLINMALLQLAKNRYSHTVNVKLQNLMQQQQYLLQRLAKNLLDPISRRDFDNIRVNLRAYEDLLFALAKQDLAIPLSLHFVSLTAPQQIISSNGNVDNHALAPDEAYYLKIVEEPRYLAFSKPYVKPEMPEYFLCNWGLGIVHDDLYYGQLDVKVALEAVQDFIFKNLPPSEIFSFKLSTGKILQSKVIVHSLAYVATLLRYTVIELLIISVVIWLRLLILRRRKTFLENKQALSCNTHKLQQLTSQYALETLANITQYKYGAMQYGCAAIELKQLLKDIQAVTAPLAMTRNITLIFPIQTGTNLQFQGDNLRIMQILSGILYEQILLLAANSTVSLQLLITDLQKGVQQLQFKLSDNGFYSKLEDRGAVVSAADVRSQGWSNIYDLVDLEEGALEHQHTAYSGNVLIFTIVRKVVQKIVNIENYY